MASRQIFQYSKLQPVNSLTPTLRIPEHAMNKASRAETQIMHVSKTRTIEEKGRQIDWLRSIGMPVISPLLRQPRLRRLLGEKEAASAALHEGSPLATYVHFLTCSCRLPSSYFYSFIFLYSSKLFGCSQGLYLGTDWLRSGLSRDSFLPKMNRVADVFGWEDPELNFLVCHWL